MIQAVLFDLDGVLTDTERAGEKMINLACLRQGFSLTPDQWRCLIGATLSRTMECIRLWYPLADTGRLMRDWTDITLEYVRAHGVPLKDGAAEVLPALRAMGLKLGLCTSNSPGVVGEYLQLLGWNEAFQTIVTASDVTRRKPFPDTYLEAARRLQVLPSACAGIEDSPGGLQAVREAGMLTVWVPDLLDASSSPRDATLSSLRLLPSYLAQVNAKG